MIKAKVPSVVGCFGVVARSSTRTDELLARLAGRGRLVVVGPGGSGKSELLEALRSSLADQAITVYLVEGRRGHGASQQLSLASLSEAGSAPDRPVTVLVDDAHLLEGQALERVLSWWQRCDPAGSRMVLTRRPGPRAAALAGAEEGLDLERERIWLLPLTLTEVANRWARRGARAVGGGLAPPSDPDEAVAWLTWWCASSPRWLDRWIEACMLARGEPIPSLLAAPRVAHPDPPAAFVDAVQTTLAQLSPPAAAFLRFWASVTSLDRDTAVTGAVDPASREASWPRALLQLQQNGQRLLDELVATGLVVPAPEPAVVPAVAATLQSLGAGQDRPQLASLLLDRLGDPDPDPDPAHRDPSVSTGPGADVELHAWLWQHSLLPGHPDALDTYDRAAFAAQQQGRFVRARLWLELALAHSGGHPSTHGPDPLDGLLPDDESSGHDPLDTPTAERSLRQRRRGWARAAARAALDQGDAAGALRLADAAGDAALVAALSGARGWWPQAANQYRRLATSGLRNRSGTQAAPGGRAAADLAALAHLASEGRASIVRAQAHRDDQPEPRSLFDAACRQFVLGATALEQGQAGLEALLEAAEVLAQIPSLVPLPETPHAVAAVAAAQNRDPARGELLLRQARREGVGGHHLDDRHDTLLAWVLLRSGQLGEAAALVDKLLGRSLTPRERLVTLSVGAALARRAASLTRQQEVWRAAEPLFTRAPREGWTLPALAELAVVGTKLGDPVAWAWLERTTAEHSTPTANLWAVSLAWNRLQAALVGGRPTADVRDGAEAVQRLVSAFPSLSGLGPAARCWAHLHEHGLGSGAGGRAQVDAATEGLQACGLSWDASQLASHAAVRGADPADARSLLEQARRLRGELSWGSAGGPDPTPRRGGVSFELTPREREVAQLFLEGHTYKEMSALLFTSVKTLERHVTNMRTKIGARDRANFMASLRDYLGRN